MNIEEFRRVYERHVRHVVAGDMKAALAEIVPERIPAIFEGVNVPQDGVTDVTVTEVRADGELYVGEAVYHADDGTIGLRSYWIYRDGRWLADVLENFDTEAGV